MRAVTGEQYTLERGGVRATIAGVGATLRELSIDGTDLTEPFGPDVRPPFSNGAVLVPWPNRVKDGIWVHDGEELQLDLTEPHRHNALHGLLRDRPYEVVDRSAEAITLAATVFPTRGWPFLLDTTVRYELVDDGLRVTHGVTNASEARAPYAVGTHPFFTIGGVPTEDLVLTVHASTRFETDDRLNPTGEVPVEGTDYDFRSGRLLGGTFLDDAFGGVSSVDGASASLQAADGRRVSLLQDDTVWPYVQVFTTPIFPKGGGKGTAIAIEPMTAPPNALNSGQSLIWLDAGESWHGSWGVRYSA
ncbi:aldose 1-epimerase [Diaminobutyricimonas aerilata]|uniref:Aldose 1-epimerase n=1 Tax=Diaminobutyricimonas aerilata TaxID=1162967 RepID=A0A2M9CMF6_9MICO|nr:aldose 1-epimerase family protein [Diaminobutyricimonas aerilata]PJJ73082.1 aldose 1-epimerase [Diaminobutyricimonas aerilata]